MPFLAPYMLWGALAAGIPIALHFFFRSRYRRVPWAAMSFLLASIEQTSRRLRFQELLLLLLRVAFLVLLAVALARPSFSNLSSAGGEPVDAVVLIDNSYSMDAREGPTTRLDQARSAALSVLDQLPLHSTVQVLTCSEQASSLGPRNPSQLDQARELLQGIQVDHQATDLLPGLTLAAEALQNGQSSSKEVYLFSDMQRSGWEEQGPAVVNRLQEMHKKARIFLVHCGQRSPANAGIVGLVPQSGIPYVGERAGFAVLVRNHGTRPVRSLTVSLLVDGQEKDRESQPLPEIRPGETRSVPLTVRLSKPGLRVLTATLKHDDLEADNRFDQVIEVRDQVRVLVVDGAPDARRPEKAASYYLMHGLRPVKEEEQARYPVQPQRVTPRQAAPAVLTDMDLCVLVNASVQPEDQARGESLSPAFLAALETFVRAGHGLVLFGGDHVHARAYNSLLHKQHDLLPASLVDATPASANAIYRLDRDSAESSAFRAFREDKAFQGLNGIEVHRRLGIEDGSLSPDTSRTLLRYADGRPALLSRRVGAGEVLLVTTSADMTWSNWPLWQGMYIPFLDAALNHLLQGESEQHNETAGTPLRWHPPEQDASRAFVLLDPAGVRHRLGTPEIHQGRPMVTAAGTPRAGIYHLAPADGGQALPGEAEGNDLGVPFAITADPRETENLEMLAEAQLDERLGFRPIHLRAGEGSLPVASERLNQEWTLWLLAGVVVLGVLEMGLAWICGRAR